jgi:hypothetical protein
MLSADATVGVQFGELFREVERATYGTVLLSDCEPQFSRVLAFAIAHPESRAQLASVFCQMLHSHITRFCMQRLQWPEVADAARQCMSEDDIDNPRYETLQRLLAVCDQTI